VDWSIPWSHAEVVNTIFLALATLVVGSVPVLYIVKANFRDPLARAILAGTGGTAFAFTATFVLLIAYHLGFNPDEWVWDWIARLTYTAVAFGQGLFLVALLQIVRGNRPRMYPMPDELEDDSASR
jgi:hypothetical protein